MHRWLMIAAYGWLALGGTLHFLIDVVSQHARGVRAPGPATTLYYGLNTSYASGQFFFGLFGLILAFTAPAILSTWPFTLLGLVAALCWLIIGYAWMEYWEPKFGAIVFGLLLIGAAIAK